MIGGQLLEVPARHWVCPNCTATHVTREALPHTPFHPCRGMGGLTAPFVEDGVAAKVEAKVREDYVGTERIPAEIGGRPIMSIVTTRDDGQDCAVFAPVATATVEEG